MAIAVKAITAAQLAMASQNVYSVTLDEAIEAMRLTAADMSVKYKETSLSVSAYRRTRRAQANYAAMCRALRQVFFDVLFGLICADAAATENGEDPADCSCLLSMRTFPFVTCRLPRHLVPVEYL